MVSHSEVLKDILTLLDKAEDRTLSFSFLLKSFTLSHRELFYLLDNLEQAGVVTHTTDFGGDTKLIHYI
jgi:hypothetical protein